MKKIATFVATALLIGWGCAKANAHAPVKPLFTLQFSHTARTAALLRSQITNMPMSGASRAWNNLIKNVAETNYRYSYPTALATTVLKTPLTNLSGQISGLDYFSFNSGRLGPFQPDQANFVAFGSSPLNTGIGNVGGPTRTFSNFSNIFYGGSLTPQPYRPVSLIEFPYQVDGRLLSGATRAVHAYLNGVASNGYNAGAAGGYRAGIQLLEHPTGGLLYGTAYYQYNPGQLTSYPAFEVFGNNSFTSEAVADAINAHPLVLTQPLQSYIQFGPFTRYINGGNFFGTYAYGAVAPPFAPGSQIPYIQGGYLYLAVGKNALNTGIQGTVIPTPFGTPFSFY